MNPYSPSGLDAEEPGVLGESRTRVLVVEDHAMVREGLIALLRQAPDIEVCGGAAESNDALECVRMQQPDIVVLDMFLEDNRDGIGLISEIRGLQNAPRILIISMHREEDIAERVARAGAHGFVNKAETTEALLDTVRVIAAGKSGFSTRVRARMLDGELPDASQPANARLTARELQVFRLIGTGLGLSEIAKRLHVSAKTVAAHRENIKNKLSCQSAGELAKRARTWLGIK